MVTTMSAKYIHCEIHFDKDCFQTAKSPGMRCCRNQQTAGLCGLRHSDLVELVFAVFNLFELSLTSLKYGTTKALNDHRGYLPEKEAKPTLSRLKSLARSSSRCWRGGVEDRLHVRRRFRVSTQSWWPTISVNAGWLRQCSASMKALSM